MTAPRLDPDQHLHAAKGIAIGVAIGIAGWLAIVALLAHLRVAFPA